MSQTGVQLVIGKLITDDDFRRRFQERTEECLAGLYEEGITLNATEIAALVEADPHLWSRMASGIDRRLRKLSATFRREDQQHRASLTTREQQVLHSVLEGFTNKEIASQVGVSESAVKATLQQLFRKNRVRSRSQLVRIAIEGGLDGPRKTR